MQHVGVFDYSTATVVGDPGAGRIASDVPTTTLSISATDNGGGDVRAYLTTLLAGNSVFVQARADAESWELHTVLSAPVDHTAWVEVPVSVTTYAGTPPNKNADVVVTTFAEGEPIPDAGFDFGMASDLTGPNARPPVGADLAKWLSITAADADTMALLDGCCTAAVHYELGRLSTRRMVDQGFAPPDALPPTVAQAMLMRAAAVYRRRNSVNGFEGFADLGAVAIRASDPDIERLIDPWRAWAFA